MTDSAVPPGTAWVPGGTFAMGSDAHGPEERPVRSVEVDGFWMDAHAVTNAEFAAFVDATDYLTVAERPLDPGDYPGAPAANLVPGSLVFTPTTGPVDLRHLSQWWAWTPGASWRHPEGPRSSVDDRAEHPVAHVAAQDAEAYAAWAGRALPTEAEWERAARGGVDGLEYEWGDVAEPEGQRRAKFWEGDFPWRSTPRDGHHRTAPVGSFPPNAFGLSDMTGNVWEWTADWYVEQADAPTSGCCVPRNPNGGTENESVDPGQPQLAVPRRVIKGGSFLCADGYCRRYRPAGRRPQAVDTGMSHIGFRTVLRSPA